MDTESASAEHNTFQHFESLRPESTQNTSGEQKQHVVQVLQRGRVVYQNCSYAWHEVNMDKQLKKIQTQPGL